MECVFSAPVSAWETLALVQEKLASLSIEAKDFQSPHSGPASQHAAYVSTTAASPHSETLGVGDGGQPRMKFMQGWGVEWWRLRL